MFKKIECKSCWLKFRVGIIAWALGKVHCPRCACLHRLRDFDRVMRMLKNWFNWRYYRYRTNWHKHPAVSPVLCWIGRHDYEVNVATTERSAKLYCFYCGAKKHSTNTSSDA